MENLIALSGMKLYLAGKMSGIPEFNFPAFHAAAARLRSAGHEVLNPAELDDGDTSKPWDYYMRKDIAMILTVEAIAVLPGWETSKGANFEILIAENLKIPVLDARTLLPLRRGKRHPRVAFTGYARSGKDACGKVLIQQGYKRVAFGDIIKRQLDPVIRVHFGFSAFTESDEEKKKIRGTLEHWGEDNYDAIFKEFFETLPELAVNTRLVRAREAEEWVKQGGVIYEVSRPGCVAETNFAERMMNEMWLSGLVAGTIINDGTLEDLERQVIDLLIA